MSSNQENAKIAALAAGVAREFLRRLAADMLEARVAKGARVDILADRVRLRRQRAIDSLRDLVEAARVVVPVDDVDAFGITAAAEDVSRMIVHVDAGVLGSREVAEVAHELELLGDAYRKAAEFATAA